MTLFNITNKTSGADMGNYDGETPEAALLAMIKDGGGPDATVDNPTDWIITEIAAV
jgi:hypothetical protein